MQGDRVFARFEGAGEWYPGTVRTVHSNETVSIGYDNVELTRLDNSASCKPIAHVRPDVVFVPTSQEVVVGLGKPDGEEEDDDTKAKFAMLMVCACPLT